MGRKLDCEVLAASAAAGAAERRFAGEAREVVIVRLVRSQPISNIAIGHRRALEMIAVARLATRRLRARSTTADRADATQPATASTDSTA